MKAAIIVILLSVAASLIAPRLISDLPKEAVSPVHEPVTLLFVGDIMLARDVENYLDREGAQYPFAHVADLLKGYDVLVGNFEGVVSDPHVRNAPFTFQFSVRPEYLDGLGETGFDILSLANNHSSDYGDVALDLTKRLCAEYRIRCAGDARRAETFTYEMHGTRIGFLFANMTWNTESVEDLVEHMRLLTEETDVQIAYLHWGTEYELMHDPSQEILARALVEAGADAVIGHHPHVVQDVGFHQGKPIFYSLGNFIFDQYWNEDVRTGLGVEMHIEADRIRYRLIPFTTEASRNQPMIMDEEEAHTLFDRIMHGQETDTFIVARDRKTL